MKLSKEINDAIWRALINHNDYLLNKVCEDDLFDQTRLEILDTLRSCKKAMEYWVKYGLEDENDG